MSSKDIYKQYEEEWSQYYFDFIIEHINIIDWTILSSNINITCKTIENNIEFPWNWKNGISNNNNITIPFIKKYINKNLDWCNISKNKNITLDDIDNNLDLPWNWCSIQFNPNITINFIKKHNDKHWNITAMTYLKFNRLNYSIDFQQLCKPPQEVDIPGNFAYFYDFNEIKEYLHEKWNWNWNIISSHKNIKLNDIENNMEYPWVWKYVSLNPNLTLKFIKKYPYKSWNWNFISKELNITYEEFEEPGNMYLFWNFELLSVNPHITFKFIKKYYKHYKYKFNNNNLLKNPFIYQKQLFITQKYKEYMAIYKIKQWWLHKILYNPRHTIGINYFKRKFKQEIIDELSV